MSPWWSGQDRERFWLEATDRKDIGVDLRAPYANVSGEEEWRYTLFRGARPGDIVFHYDKKAGAITSHSRISGPEQERPIIWAARGTYARERGAQPTELPGYFLPLDQHTVLAAPVTLDQLRTQQDTLTVMVEDLKAQHRKAIYFPFAGRPYRLNQGYAFKLPADFVASFESLAQSVGQALLPAGASQTTDSPVRRAVAQIEAAASAYRIGKLQQLRRKLRRLDRTPGYRIFSDRTTFDEWAFHNGGRAELQFNVGVDTFPDGTPAMRFGVAFSLEPSQSLPNWEALLPRIGRFNDFFRERPAAFSDLSMWHWVDGSRSGDYAPGPIQEAVARKNTFIFLGDRSPVEEFDPHAALTLFDRLLDLYEHVQEGDAAPSAADMQALAATSKPLDQLQLGSGVTVKSVDSVAVSLAERTLNIVFRHNELQNRLAAELGAQGITVKLETRFGQRAIDAVAQADGSLWFYEVKAASSARQCIREAVGQLLEYAFWPGATEPAKLIVVGEPALTDDDAAYLSTLRTRLGLQLEYKRLSLD